uniref:CSON005526 protein n=1 Tax=Culicoides sonorensis TaxID=179676 RepID=A0A336M036_CULSO
MVLINQPLRLVTGRYGEKFHQQLDNMHNFNIIYWKAPNNHIIKIGLSQPKKKQNLYTRKETEIVYALVAYKTSKTYLTLMETKNYDGINF